jgi:hypothetical protein
MIWTVPRLWGDGACWIFGGGTSVPIEFGVPQETIQKVCNGILPPSAYSEYLKPIHDQHVIGINNAYQIGNWIDILFFGDSSWYLSHRQKLANWPGLKVCCDNKFANRPREKMEGVKFLERDKEKRQGISTNPSKISWNSNSGAAAISLAHHLGVKKIFLLGFDMSLDEKSVYSHWHGSHSPPGQKPKRQPPFGRHLKAFPAIARDAKKLGIKIFNVSSVSKIDCFPKVTLREALSICSLA